MKKQHSYPELNPQKRTLLLHTCCSPYSTAVSERLETHFAVTLYFYNPNIHPEAEYEQRLEAQRTVAEHFQAPLIAAPYDPAPFAAIAAGLDAEPEGGARCTRCFTLRLEETARLAKAEGFDTFTTTLSVRPRKDAARLNEIGMDAGAKYGIPYHSADFKKQGGYQRSVALAKELGLYRQNYCGCTSNPLI